MSVSTGPDLLANSGYGSLKAEVIDEDDVVLRSMLYGNSFFDFAMWEPTLEINTKSIIFRRGKKLVHEFSLSQIVAAQPRHWTYSTRYARIDVYTVEIRLRSGEVYALVSVADKAQSDLVTQYIQERMVHGDKH